jgi:hypothetical protein
LTFRALSLAYFPPICIATDAPVMPPRSFAYCAVLVVIVPLPAFNWFENPNELRYSDLNCNADAPASPPSDFAYFV